jgi:hypothetical protein
MHAWGDAPTFKFSIVSYTLCVKLSNRDHQTERVVMDVVHME